MRLLGVILAGGRSSRFGSDKALALLDGKPLIAHVADALRPQVGALAVAGRDWGGLMRADDAPAAGLGPLGGLAGALRLAADAGFDAVLSAGCDMPGLPADLADRLRAAGPPAVARGHWLVGLWPAALAAVAAMQAAGTDRSMRGFAAACQAAPADCGALLDLNEPWG